MKSVSAVYDGDGRSRPRSGRRSRTNRQRASMVVINRQAAWNRSKKFRKSFRMSREEMIEMVRSSCVEVQRLPAGYADGYVPTYCEPRK